MCGNFALHSAGNRLKSTHLMVASFQCFRRIYLQRLHVRPGVRRFGPHADVLSSIRCASRFCQEAPYPEGLHKLARCASQRRVSEAHPHYLVVRELRRQAFELPSDKKVCPAGECPTQQTIPMRFRQLNPAPGR